MDITFYQTWYDERLRFEGSFENIVVHDEVLKQIWLPNILIHNSKRSREQGFDLSTSMARIYRDGKVTYTARYVKFLASNLVELFISWEISPENGHMSPSTGPPFPFLGPHN